MQLFVRSKSSCISVDLIEGATLNDLKAAIEDVEFIPQGLQRIVHESKNVPAGRLEDVLCDADTVTMLIDVSGGMRAKWRKKRMRRLRRKRRKMRMRAR